MTTRNNSNLVALEYLPQFDDQPLITIKAETPKEVAVILNLAKKYNIPVIQDCSLAGQLVDIDEGDSLPARLFKAVAAIFNQIDRIVSSSNRA